MGLDVAQDLRSRVCDICNKLLDDSKLVTTKTVLSILYELQSDQIDNATEDNIAGIINFWRLSRLDTSSQQQANSYSTEQVKVFHDYHSLYQKNSKYRKQLVKAKREIQFLKAKMKVLNSFYNRQRQEFIMRIEGMLYK